MDSFCLYEEQHPVCKKIIPKPFKLQTGHCEGYMSLHIHYVAVILSGDVSLLTLVVDKLTTVVEF